MPDDAPSAPGRCAACRYYKYDPRDGWGFCRRAAGRNGIAKDPESLAVADGIGLVGLRVRPEFGCVQWEPTATPPEAA